MRLKTNSYQHRLYLLIAMLFVLCSSAFSQVTVNGKVVSSKDKIPLVGVTILVKGTTVATVTNNQGVFSVKCQDPKLATLIVTYLGFNTLETPVKGRTQIDVELNENVQQLDEVVVVGYGSLKKKDLTGSVVSVKASDIAANKSANVLQVLQGKVIGLNITQMNGEAGAGVRMLLRGTRSINAGNEPLILVDGVEYGSMLDINSSDIQTIDVLKDAASTAIYGTKGANGVIIITTKRGGNGKTNVSYNTYFSFNTPTYLPQIMNGAEYQQKRYETLIADEENSRWTAQGIAYTPATGKVTWDQTAYPTPWNMFGTVTLDQLIAKKGVADKYALLTGDPTGLQLLRGGVSLDYLKMIMANSMSQNHELSITGGNDKTSFNMSLGFMDDKGLLSNDDMKRYNFKLGIDHQVLKSLKIGANILFTKKYNNKSDGNVFNQALKAGPIGILKNDDGTYKTIPDLIFSYNQYSPMLDQNGAYLNEIFTNRLFGSLYVNWDIISGLTFRSNLGVNYTDTKNGLYLGPLSINRVTSLSAQSNMFNSDNWSYTLDNTLTYKKTFGIHNIQAVAGSSTSFSQYTDGTMIRYGQTIQSTKYFDFNGISNASTSSNFVQSQMVSVFGRVNYNLMEKYLFQATLRTDGASVLYPGKKWESFPSASLGWRITEEPFMKNISFVSNLKLRYSWGVSGNAAINPYQSQTTLGQSANYYTFADQIYSQYAPAQAGNQDLTWEKTTTNNLGFDFEILNKRVFGTVDYYISNTTDLLFQVPLPLTSVYPSIMANVAATQNKGIEFTLTTVNIKQPTFEWSTDWGLVFNHNKIVKLRGDVKELVNGSDNIFRIGSPVNSFYTYQVDGFYSIADLKAEMDYVSQQNASSGTIDKGRIPMLANHFFPGDVKLRDFNKDGNFDATDKILLNADPSYTFSMNNSIHLKTKIGDFGLSVQTLGSMGQKIIYGFYANYKTAIDPVNGPYVNAWTPTNTNAAFPRYSSNGNGTQSTFNTPLKFVDGSFIKIKDITLSYNLPKSWLNTMKIANLKLYATVKNMFTFSKLENYDPESLGSLNFPLAKQWIIGLNFDF